MPKRADQLAQAIEAMLARPDAAFAPAGLESSLAPLLGIARELRDLPRESFKIRLKSDLERNATMATPAEAAAPRQTATARLRIRNVPAAIEFYRQAFGAREIMRFTAHGQIPYAEVAIGNSVIMLGEEAPEYGFPSPQALGGSPVSIHLDVEDVDAFVERAVAAGARITGPVADQFYGDRAGSVSDPFGYTWNVTTRKEHVSVEEMHRRFEALERERSGRKTAESWIPKGHQTLTPYLVAQDAPALIEFVRQVFGAEETTKRAIGSAGGVHAEVRLGDSKLMIGGGAAGLSWSGQAWPTALHVYVEDTDAVYQRALEAGAAGIAAPADQSYGERSGSVRDRFGNHWYIATARGDRYIPEGLRAVMAYLHPLRAEPVIAFLKRGLGAEEVARYATPDGVIQHARMRIGDSVVEMGEAHGPYQPMPTMFHLYVPNVDATYLRALNAGASSVREPADEPYGARVAAVQDVSGNQWYLATQVTDVR